MAKKPVDPQASETAAAKPYVVLARKYRPRTFDDLIGQAAMVQTLANAFTTGRIAQAYMLTGVRGIGKTTTARILARALNYETDTITAATINMPALGRHCAEIMESRHPDVLEMDAASNTGIDDVREIIENARYKPLIARYKVFIIDEVHMLSKNAFNALLKTLEEPPEHAKFIFATTEIRKVPVTVLSRCQRFDLRRVEAPVLVKHFQGILKTEGAKAADDALALIARAAEGSVRDGLSILDQAIAMSSGNVTAPDVRAMLGLADRSRVFDLLDAVLKGTPAIALQQLASLHHDGAEPTQVLIDLADAVHVATRTKIAGPDGAGDALSVDERTRAAAFASGLSIAILSRAWQMLSKGIEEANRSPNPLAAAEMVLIRLAYTADLPSPDELIRALGSGDARDPMAPVAPPRDTHPRDTARRDTVGGKAPLNSAPLNPTPLDSMGTTRGTPPPKPKAQSQPAIPGPRPPWEDAPSRTAAVRQPAMPNAKPDTEPDAPPIEAYETQDALVDGPLEFEAAGDTDEDGEYGGMEADIGPSIRPAPTVVQIQTFHDVLELVGRRRDAKLKVHLEEHVSLVKFDAAGAIELHLLANAPKELPNDLREKLNAWTGRKWMIAVSQRAGDKPIGLVQREQAAAELADLSRHPAIVAVLQDFPEAKITTVRSLPRAKTNDTATG
jgi:DNA polymerase III subunit gamma/tau